MKKSLDSMVQISNVEASKDSSWCYVKNSQIQGRGVFAYKDIPKGTAIIEYVGEKITNEEANSRLNAQKESGLVLMFQVEAIDDPVGVGFCVDASRVWNDSRYINHSCDPNCEIDLADGRIYIKAARDIKRDDELTYDYCLDANEMKMPCKCGAKNCRGYIVDETQVKGLKRAKSGREKKIIIPDTFNENQFLNGLSIRLSLRFNANIGCRTILGSDISALAAIDKQSSEDLYWDAGEFLEEIRIPSSFGIIAYRVSVPFIMGKNSFAYLLGHEDKFDNSSLGGLAPPMQLVRQEGKGCYLTSCAVVPCYQQKGVFKNMLEYFEELALRRDMSYIRAHTRTAENPSSRGEILAFTKTGFRITGTLKDYYDKGDDVFEVLKKI